MNNLNVYNSIHDAYRYTRQNDSRAKQKFIDFYTEGQANPAVSEILRKDALKDYLGEYKDWIQDDIDRGRDYTEAMQELHTSKVNLVKNSIGVTSQPDVYVHECNFNNKMRELYPKTLAIRTQVLNEDRISFNNKKTPKKANFIKRAQMKFHATEMKSMTIGKHAKIVN